MTMLQASQSDFRERGFRLYEQARDRSSWNPRTDIDWGRPSAMSVDRQHLAWEIASQSVYAEQAGLLFASKLLQATDDLPTRLGLATAVSDEAKHSEVFARYALRAGESVAAPREPVQDLFAGLGQLDDPTGAFLVHTFLEGYAADEFMIFSRAFADDVLGDVYSFVRRDEARHVVIGLTYLAKHLRRFDIDEARAMIARYSEVALRISGLHGPGAAEFLCGLAGRTDKELYGWFEVRHQARANRILSEGR